MTKAFRTLATLLCVLPVLAGLSAAQAKQPPQPSQNLSVAAGALHMSSRDGAVLRAASLAPGDETTTLSGSAVRDSPGRHGGKLSRRLVPNAARDLLTQRKHGLTTYDQGRRAGSSVG